MRRRLPLVTVLLALGMGPAPAHAQRSSSVSVRDALGDANGYVYEAPYGGIDTPSNSTTSDPHYDIERLTAVATDTGVRLTVRLAAPVADAGETVWVALTPTESDCTLMVLVSDTLVSGRPSTGLSNWCGEDVTVNSVWRTDDKDARADEPTAFVPYSAFPGTVPTHGAVMARAETMRDLGGSVRHVARVELDGVSATRPLQLLGRR